MSSTSNERSRVTAHQLAASGAVPNHPRWPLLVYPGAVAIAGADPAAAFEALFDRNGWPAAWRNGVYPFHHFHCDVPRRLASTVAATVQFGGKDGVVVTAQPGDVIVLPRGRQAQEALLTRQAGHRGRLSGRPAHPTCAHPCCRT
jgi:uncharacterized protein YjlB